MYGLKGTCAYAAHAEALAGPLDPAVYAGVQEALWFLSSPDAAGVPAVLAMVRGWGLRGSGGYRKNRVPRVLSMVCQGSTVGVEQRRCSWSVNKCGMSVASCAAMTRREPSACPGHRLCTSFLAALHLCVHTYPHTCPVGAGP